MTRETPYLTGGMDRSYLVEAGGSTPVLCEPGRSPDVMGADALCLSLSVIVRLCSFPQLDISGSKESLSHANE